MKFAHYLLALIITMMVVLALMLIALSSCQAGVIRLEVTAPTTNYVGPGCPDLEPDDDSDWEYRAGPPLTDLKEILIRGVRFDVPGDTVEVGRIAAAPGQVIPFDFEGEDGIHGELIAYAVDRSANESCPGPSFVFAIPAVEAPPTQPGLAAAYFDDMALTVPFGTRIDPKIDFDWDLGAPMPGMGVETFSARWTGLLTTTAAGTYRLRARVEDAVRLRLRGVLVMDDWVPQSEHNVIADVPLPAGANDFQLEYFARNGNAAMRLFWTPPGGAEAIVPASAFSH